MTVLLQVDVMTTSQLIRFFYPKSLRIAIAQFAAPHRLTALSQIAI
jgi:hypothetical protein